MTSTGGRRGVRAPPPASPNRVGVAAVRRAKVALMSISQMMHVTACAVQSPEGMEALRNYVLVAFTQCGPAVRLLLMFYKKDTPFGAW